MAPLVFPFIALLFTGFPGHATGTPAAPNNSQACSTVFNGNQARIESLAAKGDSGGIRSIFASGGCANVGLSIPAPTGKAAEAAKVKCTFKLIPPSITCVFMATVPQNQSY